MLLTVEGTYRDGKVALTETPTGVKEAKVLVTFLMPGIDWPRRRLMAYGQFAGERMSSEEDFRVAEWHGEAESKNGD